MKASAISAIVLLAAVGCASAFVVHKKGGIKFSKKGEKLSCCPLQSLVEDLS
jgi:hypothetical protein